MQSEDNLTIGVNRNEEVTQLFISRYLAHQLFYCIVFWNVTWKYCSGSLNVLEILYYRVFNGFGRALLWIKHKGTHALYIDTVFIKI